MALELQIQEAIICHEGICQTVKQYEILKDRLDRSGEYLDQADRLRDTHRKLSDPQIIQQHRPEDTANLRDVDTDLTDDENLVRIICQETGAPQDVVRKAVDRYRQSNPRGGRNVELGD